MLNVPYSWGGLGYNTDCSSFLRKVFLTMGLELPRSSILQIKMLKQIDINVKKGKGVLNELVPFQSFFYVPGPGHIMLYIGNYKNEAYVIHNIWSYHKMVEGEEKEIYIKKTVVSDLNLGNDSNNGSLLERISRAGVF